MIRFDPATMVQQLIAYGEPSAAKHCATLTPAAVEHIGIRAYELWNRVAAGRKRGISLDHAICLAIVEHLEGHPRELKRTRRIHKAQEETPQESQKEGMPAPLRIRAKPKAFLISHPSGIQISALLTESGIILTVPEAASSRKDMGTGWTWYRLPSFSHKDTSICLSLGFNSGRLRIIMANGAAGGGWGDWSEARERATATTIGAWLETQGLPAGKYPWGIVSVGYDAKSATGGATIELSS